MTARFRSVYGGFFLLLAVAVWLPRWHGTGILRVLPARPILTAAFLFLAMLMFFRERRRSGRVWRFARWSRWLLVAAWAIAGLALLLSQLVDYDDECQVVSGGGFHPVATALAIGAFFVLAVDVLSALVETVQRRTAGAALTFTGAVLSLYPLFVIGLLVAVGCDNS